jgi:Protein of unknown function (DUF433)
MASTTPKPAIMIDWRNCPDAERTPDALSGAWRVKGTRIRCKDILDQFDGGCTAEEIAGPDISEHPV